MRRTRQRVPTYGLTSHDRVSGTHRLGQLLAALADFASRWALLVTARVTDKAGDITPRELAGPPTAHASTL